LKIKYLFILGLFISQLLANQTKFIIFDDGLIDPRAQDKITQIGTEVQQKLGYNIYVVVKKDNGVDLSKPRKEKIDLMRKYDKWILSKIDTTKNYVVMTLVLHQHYANILYSKNFENIIDTDDILQGYVIPLLASKDKNTLYAKTSAACLNGYAQIADVLAKSKNIKLKSNIGNGSKEFSTIWKAFMYTMVVFGILAYIVIIMKEKKRDV